MSSGDYTTQGGFLSKLGYERPSWKRRYFVLHKNEMSYYTNDKDAKATKNEKGRFYLDFLTRNKIKPVESGTILASNALSTKDSRLPLKKPYLIQIGDCRWKESELRTFYVSCDRPEDREEWLKALKSNLEIYVQSPEGKADLTKIPSDGPRKEAYTIWLEEQKKN